MLKMDTIPHIFILFVKASPPLSPFAEKTGEGPVIGSSVFRLYPPLYSVTSRMTGPKTGEGKDFFRALLSAFLLWLQRKADYEISLLRTGICIYGGKNGNCESLRNLQFFGCAERDIGKGKAVCIQIGSGSPR